MLTSKGRLQLHPAPLTWMRDALALGIGVLPISPEVAVKSSTLSDFHGDPADRLIVATALIHGCTLATYDMRIHDWAAAQDLSLLGG